MPCVEVVMGGGKDVVLQSSSMILGLWKAANCQIAARNSFGRRWKMVKSLLDWILTGTFGIGRDVLCEGAIFDRDAGLLKQAVTDGVKCSREVSL